MPTTHAPSPLTPDRAAAPEARRARLLDCLRQADRPLTGGELAALLGVSRQIIVQDIAVLRARGAAITATPRGYQLASPATGLRAMVAVRHTPAQTADELFALVDAGVEVIDVIVDHPLYGELRGNLRLASRADVEQFLDAVSRTRAHLLSELTDGLHVHTLEARSLEALERARNALRTRGYLIE